MAAQSTVDFIRIVRPEERASKFELRRNLVPHLPGLRAHARNLCRNPEQAEDLVQATVLRALCFESTFRPDSNLRAWLHQILHSVFIADYRKKRRERRALERFAADPSSWVNSNPLEVQPQTLSPRVKTAIAALPRPFAQVVCAVDLDGQGYRDAARAAGVPVGTIMSRLFRGRQRLRLALAETELTPQAA